MTARSKLSDSYKREGFTPFFEEKSLNKFQEECLTKVDRFYRMLYMKCDGGRRKVPSQYYHSHYYYT